MPVNTIFEKMNLHLLNRYQLKIRAKVQSRIEKTLFTYMFKITYKH